MASQSALPTSPCSSTPLYFVSTFFFFNDTATTEIYTLSLHDALPISSSRARASSRPSSSRGSSRLTSTGWQLWRRSEEHTSELQSQSNLVCRLLLEKKKSDAVVLARAHRQLAQALLLRDPARPYDVLP